MDLSLNQVVNHIRHVEQKLGTEEFRAAAPETRAYVMRWLAALKAIPAGNLVPWSQLGRYEREFLESILPALKRLAAPDFATLKSQQVEANRAASRAWGSNVAFTWTMDGS